jgi:hypothetical protein
MKNIDNLMFFTVYHSIGFALSAQKLVDISFNDFIHKE